MKFNEGQLLAINTIDRNVGVVAGAGTGKTAILTHRFINIIKNSNLDPKLAMESILAITFTNKATDEMIDRIRKEIILLDKETKYKGLINHTTFLNVSTIDSFCKKIVDENTLKIGLSSDYEIISEFESTRILREIINDIISEEITSNELLQNFVEINKFLRIRDLVNQLESIYRKIQSKGYDFENLYLLNPLHFINPMKFEIFVDKIKRYYYFMLENKYINGRHNIVKSMKNGLLENLTSANKESRFEYLKELRDGFSKIKNGPEEEKNYIVSIIEEQLIEYEKEDLKYYKLIKDLLIEIDKSFRKSKIDKGRLEFNDLLYYTKFLLEDEKVLEVYKNKFKYLMIDEFQDTNKLQRDIFYLLASDKKLLDRNNLFVVGDPKQSIYGFRGSDLSVYEEAIKDIRDSNGLIIELKENYRSSDELIAFSNKVFSQLMEKNYIFLNSNRDFPNKKISYYNIIDENLNEAEVVARKIIELNSGGKNYGDIAVLFRSTANLKLLENALNKYNIPFVNPKSKEFYNKREILDILLFLKFLNDPHDSANLYGLLRSNFFLLDDNTLYRISKYSSKSLYDSLNNFEDEGKIKWIREILNKMYLNKNLLSIYELLKEFFEITSYYEVLAATSSTLQEVENVKKFENIVIDFESTSSKYLNEFLDYLLLDDKDDLNEAVIFDNDAVNLMTIHGSKGLEFNTVLFYDSKNSFSGEKDRLLVNSKYGYGIKTRDDGIVFDQVKSENNKLEKEERDRLLYVCITRAEEEFVFFSVKENDKKSISNSFLNILESVDDYKYNIINQIEEYPRNDIEQIQVTSNEKELATNKVGENSNELATSSITSYLTFSRCKREYFYKYKLGLKNLDMRLEKAELENFEEANLLNGIKASSYGTLVHSIIENYNENASLEDQIDIQIRNFALDKNPSLINRLKKHLNSYINLEAKGEKIFEFEFMLKLDQGYFSGSIDQIIFNDNKIDIVDFKTNRVKDIDELVDYYTPQIRIYSIAVEEIFKIKPNSAKLLFLDIKKEVEIERDEKENKILLDNINSFLRFIRSNDSIDEYEGCSTCNEYCNYSNICDRNRNGL